MLKVLGKKPSVGRKVLPFLVSSSEKQNYPIYVCIIFGAELTLNAGDFSLSSVINNGA